jgi:hypothetical protein
MTNDTNEQSVEPKRPSLPEQSSPLDTANWDNRAFTIPGSSRQALPNNPKPDSSRDTIPAPRHKRVKLPRVND